MEKVNKLNLKEDFLNMYIENLVVEKLLYFRWLVEHDYLFHFYFDAFIEEYINSLINKNKNDWKILSVGSSGDEGNSIVKEEFRPEDMDSQTFELYCILMLIKEYEKEQDKDKKIILHNEIEMAIGRYRYPIEKPKTNVIKMKSN